MLEALSTTLMSFKPFEISIWTTNNSWIRASPLEWTLTPTYPLCQSINLNDFFDIEKNIPSSVYLVMNQTEGVGISVMVTERLKQAKRVLNSQFKSYRGPFFSIQNLGKPRDVNGLISLSQTILIDEDMTKPCENYPSETFNSFGDCDTSFVHNQIMKMYGLSPFWASIALDEVTHSRRVGNFSRFATFDLYTGTKSSNCKNPCVVTEIKASRIKDSRVKSHKTSFIYLTIDQTVDITEHYYPEFSISNFLSSVGGSLGLWLGVGVVQIGGYSNLAIKHLWEAISHYKV